MAVRVPKYLAMNLELKYDAGLYVCVILHPGVRGPRSTGVRPGPTIGYYIADYYNIS